VKVNTEKIREYNFGNIYCN